MNEKVKEINKRLQSKSTAEEIGHFYDRDVEYLLSEIERLEADRVWQEERAVSNAAAHAQEIERLERYSSGLEVLAQHYGNEVVHHCNESKDKDKRIAELERAVADAVKLGDAHYVRIAELEALANPDAIRLQPISRKESK
jgi:hypothetical protein